jgi:Protein of unknown function (DUF1493)
VSDSVEDRVYALVTEECGIGREKLTPNTSLSCDLGMEGDDDVEFFKKFSLEFSLDLKALGEDWRHYFATEGVPIGTALLVVIPGSIISIGLIRIFSRLPDWICFIFSFSLWLVGFGFWSRWRNKHRDPQITIQDLIDSVRVGTWTKEAPGRTKKTVAAKS